MELLATPSSSEVSTSSIALDDAASSGEEHILKTAKPKVLSPEVESYRKLRKAEKLRYKHLKSKAIAQQYCKVSDAPEPRAVPTGSEVQDPLEDMEDLVYKPRQDLAMLRALIDLKNETNKEYLRLVWSHFPKFRTHHNLLFEDAPAKTVKEDNATLVFLHKEELPTKLKYLGVRVFETATETFPHKLQPFVALLEKSSYRKLTV